MNRINLVIHVLFQGELAHARKKQSSLFNRKKSQIGSVFAHACALPLEEWTHAYGEVCVGYFTVDAIALSFVA